MKKYFYRFLLILCVFLFATCAKNQFAPEPESLIVLESAKEIPSEFEIETSDALVPVIAYHHVTDAQKNDMTVTPELFNQHMQFLADQGYQPITLDTWSAAALHGADLPAKPIMITFDDAWKSQYEFAVPILEKFGFPATFYAYTEVIGNKTTMTWDQLRNLAEKGHCIGCHSATHCNLALKYDFESKDQYKERINREIAGAKDLMEEHLGVQIRHFCYPYGYYNTEIFTMLERAGYVSGVTVNPAVNSFFTPLFQLDRYIIAPWTTVEKLGEKLKDLPLEISGLEPMNGEICTDPVKEVKVKLSGGQNLTSVRMKWKWKWTDSYWNSASQTVTHTLKEPLKDRIYTAQIHGWDAESNHYSAAWLFEKKKKKD